MSCKIAVVGAHGLLGRVLVRTLSERAFPFTQLRLFDEKKAGGIVEEGLLIEELSEHALREGGFRYVFFAAGAKASERFIPHVQNGTAIDLSAYSRTNASVPLIVPEINGAEAKGKSLIASPDCLGVQLSLSLFPISELYPIKRVVLSSYQSVSGAGGLGVDELERQIEDIAEGKEARVSHFPKQIAYNIFPQVDVFGASGWTKEEEHLLDESRRLLKLPSLELAATCARVPVLRGHSLSVSVQVEGEVSTERITDAWKAFRPLSVYEDNAYPTPWELEESVKVGIGRLRKDPFRKDTLHFWCVADNLTRDTALNAVLIAEGLL